MSIARRDDRGWIAHVVGTVCRLPQLGCDRSAHTRHQRVPPPGVPTLRRCRIRFNRVPTSSWQTIVSPTAPRQAARTGRHRSYQQHAALSILDRPRHRRMPLLVTSSRTDGRHTRQARGWGPGACSIQSSLGAGRRGSAVPLAVCTHRTSDRRAAGGTRASSCGGRAALPAIGAGAGSSAATVVGAATAASVPSAGCAGS